MPQKRILVAPLNWGLGHATRCIPVINALLHQDFEPVLASDGAALELLKKEFPSLEWHKLPGYNIKYPRNPAFFSLKLLLQTPHILKCIREEKKITTRLVETQNLGGIISDNRWGVRSGKVPSVFITHQVKVFSGLTTPLSTYIQQRYIKKFDECWIPDNAENPNLSGAMGHLKGVSFPVKYMGVLSRLEKEVLTQLYDITVLLSGPEPQRAMLETILEKKLKKMDLRILIISGVVEDIPTREVQGNITRLNFLTTIELQKALNSSDLVISRSGYTSLMDLAKLEKKVFFIPTPGQPEQLYLAKKMKREGLAEFCEQKDFDIKMLDGMQHFKKLPGFRTTQRPGGIFALFKGK